MHIMNNYYQYNECVISYIPREKFTRIRFTVANRRACDRGVSIYLSDKSEQFMRLLRKITAVLFEAMLIDRVNKTTWYIGM